MELQNPNPFSVFVGPNGAGKSNIFEAIEFSIYGNKFNNIVHTLNLFGGASSIFNYSYPNKEIRIDFLNDKGNIIIGTRFDFPGVPVHLGFQVDKSTNKLPDSQSDVIIKGHSRIFLNNHSLKRVNTDDNSKLNFDASNLEKVLSRVLQNENTRVEIVEWLQILIPEFKDIQIETSSLSGDVNYAIFEKHTNKPFPKHLISDGTKNILALLTAVYQSDEPQFLCIEEPENGLHPHVIEHLVALFRSACKEKGHYIWLNSHSQTLVRQLTADEIIVVEKKNGATTSKQFQGKDFFGMKMDDAWLTNALGGGLP